MTGWLFACLLAAAAQEAPAPGPFAARASLDSALDRTASGEVFVELALDRERAFVEERVALRIRFGIEERFLAQNLVPLFPQRFDLPVQLLSPWAGEILAGVEMLPTPAAPGGRRLVVDERIAEARELAPREEGGRRWRVFEVEQAFVAASPGRIELPAPRVRYAFATRFEESFVHERVALDRADAFARGAPAAIEIVPLPEQGRPVEFTGAVGRFTVRATAEPVELARGGSFRLEVTIAGEGNFARFESPSFRELERFHVLGTLDERGAAERSVRYDLSPRDERVREVPALAFAYFDPAPPAGYRIARSEPIALSVTPGAAPANVRDVETGDDASIGDPGTRGAQSRARVVWIAGVLGLALLLVLALRRRRAGMRGDPAGGGRGA